MNAPRIVLWCLFLWYLVVLARYFDGSARLWLTSLGLSVILGVALLLNAGWGSPGRRLDGWQIFRFFLTPLCSSSFAALVKGQGFVVIFSPSPLDTTMGLGICFAFLVLVRIARHGPATA